MTNITSLLVDYNNVIKPNNLPDFKRKVSPVPDTNHTLGLVLVVPSSVITNLNNRPMGISRINYLNDSVVLNSISGFAYLVYDSSRGVCEITGLVGDVLTQIVDGSISGFPNNIILTIGTDTKTLNLENVLSIFAKAGFSDPFITNMSSMGVPYNSTGICMSRINDVVTVSKLTSPEVRYMLEQVNNDCCSVKLQFSDDTLAYMKKLSNIGTTLNNNGTMSQKEVAGRLFVSSISDDLVHVITLDQNSTFLGVEEGVTVAPGIYSFHSHPREAYDRHDVHYGWPSAQDYLGFVAATYAYSTVFHAVASVEGIYVMAYTECWTRNGKKEWTEEMNNFIRKEFDVKCKKGDTVDWYLEKINRLAYEGCPMFSIQLLKWEKANQKFVVYFSRDGMNCFATEQTLDRYKKLQSWS